MKPLILLAFALPLVAQFPLHFDLSGGWRLSDGDDTSYSRPDFDDSLWKPMPLPRQGSLPYGTHWLRRQIEIPPGTDTARLVLTLGSFMEDYEIHLNGRLVGRRGDFRLSRTYVARAQSFPVPPEILVAGQPAVIALRFWRPVWTSARLRSYDGVADEGPYLLSYRENAPHDVAASGMMKRERLGVTFLVMTTFNLVFALLLLLAWLMERERTEMLYLIGFLLAEAVLRFTGYVSFIADWPHSSTSLPAPALTVNGAFLTLLAMEVAGYRRGRLQVVVWLPTLFQAGMNWIVWLGDRGFDGYFAWQQISALLTGAVDLTAVGILAHSIWRHRQDRPWTDGRSLLAAALMLAALMHVPGYGATLYRPLQIDWVAGGFYWNSYQAVSMLLTVAITFLVLHRLGADRREKMRLSGEVAAARVVQESQIGSPDSVATPGFEVEAAYLPASEVGGDVYFTLPDASDGSLLVVVGDVSGKGMRAALLVGHISGALSNERSRQPAEVLANLNQSLVGRVSGGFVTCGCARFDADGTVTVANAGHLAPYVGGREVEVEAGLPLGVVSGVVYAESSLRLDGKFMMMSDGVVEAENAQRELFGFDRTREISTKSAREIAEAAKAWGQNDDITVVTVRRNG